MRRSPRSLLLLALPLLSAACGAATEDGAAQAAQPVDDPATMLVGAGDLGTERFVVDLRDASRWVFTSPADQLPLDRVDVIAPDGTTQQLQDWLSRAQDLLGDDPTGGRPFLLQPTSLCLDEQPAALADDCYLICHECENGIEICRMPCDVSEYAPIFDDMESEHPP